MKSLEQELAEIERAGLLRTLRAVSGAQDREIVIDGERALNFSSNNYLCLAANPDVRRAAQQALDAVGLGSGASRLISGTEEHHLGLEAELARFHGREAALLFNSGYQANVGTIQAIVGRGDEIFSDELNHASIIDGCRLSRAKVHVYRHRDVDGLARALEESSAARRLVVTDAIFSMDGDRAPLAQLSQLCGSTNSLLMVDEAHAVGVIGPGGRGWSAELGVEPDVLVGTLGKAFGTFGAYVAGSNALRTLLLNRARSFVYSTAIPPALAAASGAALTLVAGEDGQERRQRLTVRYQQLTAGLRGLGLEVGAEGPAIVPILIGDDHAVMHCTNELLSRGVYVQGIRPPTVAPGTARLRVTVMSEHTSADIERLLEGLQRLIASGRIPRGAS